MGDHDKPTMAETIDRFLQVTAVAVFLMSFAYAAGAAMYVVDEQTHAYLDTLEMILGISVLVILLPVFLLTMFRLPKSFRRRCMEPDGYIANVFKRSSVSAFSVSFIFLIFLDYLTQEYPMDIPTNFFIKLPLMVMLGIFSVTFFYRIRAEGGGEPDDEFDR